MWNFNPIMFGNGTFLPLRRYPNVVPKIGTPKMVPQCPHDKLTNFHEKFSICFWNHHIHPTLLIVNTLPPTSLPLTPWPLTPHPWHPGYNISIFYRKLASLYIFWCRIPRTHLPINTVSKLVFSKILEGGDI